MHSRCYKSLLSIVVFIVCTESTYTVETEEYPSIESRTFFKAGNITLAGLFPVHVHDCSNPSQFRSYYMALSEAMVFAVNEVNRNPKLLPNATLGFEIYDSCLKPRLAMETALEFVNRLKFTSMYAEAPSSGVCHSHWSNLKPVPAVIGLGNSANSILVSNLLQIEHIPMISYAATSDELSKTKTYPSFLRTVPPDRFQSQAMVDIASYFNWSYIAAIAEDNAYGRSGIEYFRKQMSPRGICLATESYFPAGKNDTRAKLQKIIQELKKFPNVQVVILYCTKSHAKMVIEEALLSKLGKKTWIASEGWGDTSDVVTDKYLPVIKGLIGIVLPDIVVEKFVQHLTGLSSKYRPATWWTFFWEDEFKCSFTPKGSEKLCENDLKITREIYHRRLHSSLSTNVIDAVYAVAHALDAIYKCQMSKGLGKCPSVEPHVDPKYLLQYLKRTNFTNPFTSDNAEVSFDSNGDPEGSYSIVNLQKWNGEWKFREVGRWIATRRSPLSIDTSLIKWNGDSEGRIPNSVCSEVCKPGYWQTRQVGCCWECIKCSQDSTSKTRGALNCTKCAVDTIPNSNSTQCVPVPVVYVSWSHPIGISLLSISAIGITVTIFFIAIFIKYNSTPVVKASNRELSYMLLFCIAMCYMAPVVYLSEPSPVGCVSSQIWFYLFYTTCISILVAKTNRIVTLFHERTPRTKLAKGITGRYRHVLFVVIATLSEVVVIVIWVVVDPPYPYIDKTTRTEYIITCKRSSKVGGQMCEYLLMSLLICMSLVCCYFAYKARRLPDNFNEGKFIAFSMYVLVISWVTFYPVFLNIQDMYTVVVLSATTVVAASGLLVCMFLPKVHIILFRPEKNTKQYMQQQLTRHAFRAESLHAAASPLQRVQRSPGKPRGDSLVTSSESSLPRAVSTESALSPPRNSNIPSYVITQI